MEIPHPKEKIRWQCRRGMLELDLLLGRFFETQFDALTKVQQSLFVELLQQADQTLYRWLITSNINRESVSNAEPKETSEISEASNTSKQSEKEIVNDLAHEKFISLINQIRVAGVDV